MNDIDLTKILKDCPKGWKFYTTVWGDVEFDYLIEGSDYPIHIKTRNRNESYTIRNSGRLSSAIDAGCIIFPSKDQRDWSKFTAPWYKKDKLVEPKFHVGQYVTDGYVGGQITNIEDNYHCYKILDFMGGTNTTIPFTLQDNYHLWTINDAKDGDVLATSAGAFIYNGNNGGGSYPGSYCGINTLGNFQTGVEHRWTRKKVYPATKEQRDTLMKAINDAGYEWDAEKKELKKLVKVPDRFDPKTLKPFDKVLIKSDDDTTWVATLFSHIIKFHDAIIPGIDYLESVTSYCTSSFCIPYNEETKHLVGTSDEAPKYYRYWED